jgi:polysaccharide chain length determinant protein (PEP-CTERM system associated)
MIGNRELSTADYLAMFRRRLMVIAIPAILGPVAGFLISYAIPAQYLSRSLVLVEGQKVAEGYVKPVVKEDVSQRILVLQQQVLSRARLQALIERLGLSRKGNLDDTIDDIQQSISIGSLSASEIAPLKRTFGGRGGAPGFYVSATANDPHVAQQLCGAITSMLLEENLRSREQVAEGTTDFLAVQLEEAKRNLDGLDSKLTAFKQQHFGQLPEDDQRNLQMLTGLNSQFEASSQAINRAQQDKSYTESLLAQQRASWRSLQNESNPATLEQQLAQLQSQLVTLQGRYTDDHPDVMKAKSDIAQIKRELKAMNSSNRGTDESAEKTAEREPPEIQQLRLQVRRYDDAITRATREQTRLQNEIHLAQNRLSMSPVVEEQYKILMRDYETGEKRYSDLLVKKNESKMQGDLERGQQGEQMGLLNPASFPDKPSSPNRLQFAGAGLGAGLVLGVALAFFLEVKDRSIRTEEDVVAILNLPVLVSLHLLSDRDHETGKKQDDSNEFSDPPQRAKA